MYPRRLIAILEQADSSFQDLFYPIQFRCPLDARIVRAIDEHWPAYFPTRKECRGRNWSLTIPENKPLYRPNPKSVQKLTDWKKSTKSTIAEMRVYQADITWKRFVEICRNSPRLSLWLNDFKPLADFLISEESLWPRNGGALVGQDDLYNEKMRALLAPGSPYHHADSDRLRFLKSKEPTVEKIQMIGLMQQLYDRPLMVLAILQACANKSPHSQFWLPIQDHIAAIIKTPLPLTFRKTWLEHAMQVSGAITKAGKSVPRKWAKMLVVKSDLNVINAKAIEVHYWLHGRKQPSMESVRRAGRVVFANSKLNTSQAEAGKDLWLFSWMVTLWLEKHFVEIAAEFKNDRHKIKNYYQRFFHYLKIVSQDQSDKGAGGLFARQPCK
ncbi:MAG TPA: hypothetical protein VGY56_08560 [Verrucomicrobiae bacterium]|nr:hypothetical protein [Verrucomicrobiae bacterium]